MYKGGRDTAADFPGTVANHVNGPGGDDWHACCFGSEVEVSLGS
ncbi:hypothetical protein ABZX83_21270 [Streptomyces thermoviolaceus]|nr:hypothetical protein [Streptomyces thermoviolaceus]WTD49226.1 hypothetical protein OG899_17935 [Streptomyces thermoviolaceus]